MLTAGASYKFPTYSPGASRSLTCRRIQWQQIAHRWQSLLSTLVLLFIALLAVSANY